VFAAAMIDISRQGLEYREPACTGRILSKRKTIFALFLLAAIFEELSASVKLPIGAEQRVASATSGNPNASSDNSEQEGPRVTIPEEKEHGRPQTADDFTRVLGLPISNSMIVSWIVAVGLITIAHFATRNMKQAPGRKVLTMSHSLAGLRFEWGGKIIAYLCGRCPESLSKEESSLARPALHG
jgi:hypothetical protein